MKPLLCFCMAVVAALFATLPLVLMLWFGFSEAAVVYVLALLIQKDYKSLRELST